jgi:hypothetical protein
MTPASSTDADPISAALIAPCGMNCRLCRAYARAQQACPGCRGDDSVKAKTRVHCRIKHCEHRKPGTAGYCFECDRFPCDRLNHLDERYRAKYGMSMVDNLLHIKQHGIQHFLRSEQVRWTCPECRMVLCVHQPQCLACGYKWR